MYWGIQHSPIRERLRTHKVFTKDQCFYINYRKFSIKIICFGCVLEYTSATYDFMEKY